MTRNDGKINLSAQERIRADEAVRFHKTSGHMGTQPMNDGLDHGLFNTHQSVNIIAKQIMKIDDEIGKKNGQHCRKHGQAGKGN